METYSVVLLDQETLLRKYKNELWRKASHQTKRNRAIDIDQEMHLNFAKWFKQKVISINGDSVLFLEKIYQSLNLAQPPEAALLSAVILLMATANSQPNAFMEDSYVDRTSLPVLHPSRMNGAKWFKNNTEVSTEVRKTIEECFKGPWYSWKKVPPHFRRTWFSMFKKKFNWDASINYQVEKEFEKLAAYRLKGMVSVAKNGKEKPSWILGDYWIIMQAYWATEKAKEKSASARGARLSTRNGLGPHKHRAGSRSYVKHHDVLEANNEDCSFIAVMKKTHQKPDGTYVDEQARIVAEAYEKHVEERLEQLESSGIENATAENLDLCEKNEIYVKAAGVSKHGCVFGLGALQSKVSPSIDASSSAPQASEEMETITKRLEALELSAKENIEENLRLLKKLEKMEEIVESLSSNV